MGKNKTVFGVLIALFALLPMLAFGAVGKATNAIGTNDDDNAFSSSSVASDRDGSLLERNEYIIDLIGAVTGSDALLATVTSSADTTHSVYSTLTGYGDGFFVTGWTMIVVYDAGGANAAPEDEVVDVTGYTSATGTFTHGATTQLAAGDKILLMRDELVSMYRKALPTTPVTNSLAYRLSQYLASGDGDWAAGTALPSNVSLYDTIKYLIYLTTGVAADADLSSQVADGSALSHIMTAGADTSDFQASTDSLEAISTALATADGNVDSILVDTAAVDDMQEQSISKAISTIANGNNDLFVVAGGPIKIIEIVGYVVTQIGAESVLINYNIDPTAPATDTAFGTDGTALETNADAVGTVYTWDGVVANDLTATTNGVALGTPTYSGLIVPVGSIELAAVHDGTADGAITVYMRYIPLASGVTVTAAP